MIYLSAQPDDFYFVWQLELQIRNFSSLGIAKEDCHILIGIDPQKGLSAEFRDMMKRYASLASFYVYNDTRKSKNYIPSLRPHIIKKHFTKYPDLRERSIFYHDSDILFRTLPVNGCMLSDDTSYVSDTRSYLDSKYVIAKGGKEALEIMCSITGITVQQAIEHDAHCGGAQYLLKHVDKHFWDKIEKRSELIYTALRDINISRSNELLKSNGGRLSEYKGIQAWCADMWAIFYTLIEEKREVRIADTMRFCWANSSLEEWYKCSILHYTGNQEHDHPTFKKSDYTQYRPEYDWKLRDISPNTCSIKVVEQILQFRTLLPKYDLRDTLFVVRAGDDFITTLVIEFLSLYLQTNILIVTENQNMGSTSDAYSYLAESITPCSYDKQTDVVESFKTKGINYVVLYPFGLIVHPQTLYSVLMRTHESRREATALETQYYVVDKLMTQMFQKMKETELFYSNKGKFFISQEALRIECYTMDAYLRGDTPHNGKAISKKLIDECFVLS